MILLTTGAHAPEQKRHNVVVEDNSDNSEIKFVFL